MAAKPYTFRIAYAEGVGKTVTYTVPEGRRVVVTNINAAAGDDAAAQVFVAVHGIYAYSWIAPGKYTSQYAAVKLVAYERETVTLLTSGVDARAMVCGYIFDDDVGNQAAGQTEVKLTPPRAVIAPLPSSS